MKKLLALLLAAVMCLSLVACGGESNDGGGEQAVSNNGTDIQYGAQGSAYADHPLLQVLYGEWKLQDAELGENKYRYLIVNEDGSCLVDGKDGNWEISDETADFKVEIHIYIDGEYFAGAVVRGENAFSGLIMRAKTVAGLWEKVN